MPKIKIGGIMHSLHLAQVGVLGVPDKPGIAAAVLGALGKARINVQFIVQCIDMQKQTHIALCIAQDDLEAALDIVHQLKSRVGAHEINGRSGLAVISIFGPDFRERPSIAGVMFNALASQGINILAISTSISTVSCVISADRFQDAVRILEETFDLP